MIPLTVITDLEQERSLTDPQSALHGLATHIGLLRHGTAEGRATVGLRVQLDDGREVFVETTWRLLKTAVAALAASPISREEVG